jgi:Predicted membrane protein (DUF2232)
MEVGSTARRGGRAWLIALFLVAMTIVAAMNEAWLAAGGVVGTALAAMLVQIAPPLLVLSVPVASAGILAALHVAAPAASAAILRTEIVGLMLGLLVKRGLPPLVAILGAALPLVLPGLTRFLTDGGTGLLQPDTVLVEQVVADFLGQYRQLNIPEERIAEMGEILRQTGIFLVSVLPAIRFIGIVGVLFMVYLVCQSIFTRLGFGIRPIERFPLWRLSHWYVWALAAGLAGVLLPTGSAQVAAKNLLVVMIAAYFVQGLSVTQCLMVRRGVGAIMRIVIYTTAILAIFPFFAAMTMGIGLFDTWFDFRGLEPPPPQRPGETDDGENEDDERDNPWQ